MTTGAAGGPPRLVLVRGTGLIGTSVALALMAAGIPVLLDDPDRERLALAVSLGAGQPVSGAPGAGRGEPDLVVIAAPPALVGGLAAADVARTRQAVVTHVAGVQLEPQREVEAAGVDLTRFVGGHPVAGREVSGPANASPDLFADRPWLVCPGPGAGPSAVAAVIALARSCRAQPVVLDPVTHDALLARLSHLPQLVASALAAGLVALPAADVALGGTGLRDTTRIADSDPQMWAEIAAANAAPVAAAIRELAADLSAVAAALDAGGEAAAAAVRDLVRRGRAGRALLPGKHGGEARTTAEVHVVVPDQPGALAALLVAVAGEAVNLEDLRVDHAPGQSTGSALLAVEPGAAERLIEALRAAGWVAAPGGATAV